MDDGGGDLLLRDLYAALSRHFRVARLLDPHTPASAAGIGPLYDAVLLRSTADEWIVAGVERVAGGLQEIDVAQTWLVSLVRMIGSADASVGSSNVS